MALTVIIFMRSIAELSLRIGKFGLIPTLTLVSFACSTGESTALPINTLVSEYEQSKADARRKYDGREITIRGYARTAPTMSRDGEDQGAVMLEENELRQTRHVACWFSRDQAEQFSRVRGQQYLTVRGVFNGEADAELKFCKLVGVE